MFQVHSNEASNSDSHRDVLNWRVRVSPMLTMGLFFKQILYRTMAESHLKHTVIVAGLGHSVLNHNTCAESNNYFSSVYCDCYESCIKY